jgi:hypothetical protein
MTPEPGQLAPAKGICWGLALSVPIWIALYLIAAGVA